MKIKVFIIFILLMFFISNVSSEILPHAFRGFVRLNDEILNGDYIITASVNGKVSSYSYINDGFYELVSNGESGDEIQFFLNGDKIDNTRKIVPFEITDLDLNIESLPKNRNFCGNAVCDYNECSFCELDCPSCFTESNVVASRKINIEVVVENPPKISQETKSPIGSKITGFSVAVMESNIGFGWVILIIILIAVIWWDRKRRMRN